MDVNSAIKDAIEFGNEIANGDEDFSDKQEYEMDIKEIPSTMVGEDDLSIDYKQARNMLYTLSGVCQQVINNSMTMLLDVQHPRSVEAVVAAMQLMRTLITDMAGGLHEKHQRVISEMLDNLPDNEDIDTSDDMSEIVGSLQEILDGIENLDIQAKDESNGKGTQEQGEEESSSSTS